MILADIEQGHGVVVLDPHGDLVSKLLDRISRQHADRVIYLDPGDPDHVPMWNPLTPPPTKVMDRGRAADDIVSGFKKFIEGWGDRLEHLLRHAVDGVMCLPGGSLLDVSNVLRQYSPEGKALRDRIKETTDSEISRRFWSEDFPRYTKVDLVPPQHKLSKLLGSGPVSLMLSQPDSAFQFRDIMDEGRILLVNLANLGSETRNVLGCFMLSSLYHAALSRSSLPEEQRRPFHAYCDEFHRFATDALGDVIAECRKFCVSMTLAHQHLNQLTARTTGALSGVGSMIMLNPTGDDARNLQNDLRGMATDEDLKSLKDFEAIARIGAEVVRIKTLPDPSVSSDNCREQIIAASRKRYYRPTSEVREMLARRSSPRTERSSRRIVGPVAKSEEVKYEEF